MYVDYIARVGFDLMRFVSTVFGVRFIELIYLLMLNGDNTYRADLLFVNRLISRYRYKIAP